MANTNFEPRPSQARILEYSGGRMGVSAVPGSGKTWTLSNLAAKLVRETNLKRGQQISLGKHLVKQRKPFRSFDPLNEGRQHAPCPRTRFGHPPHGMIR